MAKNHGNISIAEEFDERIRQENQRAKIMKVAPILVLVALIIFFSIAQGGAFASADNVLVIINQMAIPLLIAIGLTFVLMIGSIDLSIDGVVGLSGSLMSLMVLNSKNANNMGIWGILISIGACVLIGFFVGVIHVKAKIPSFMVSFSFMYIAQGLAMLSYGGQPATITDPVLVQIPKMTFIGLPVITWVSIIVLIITFLIQEYSAFGRHVYAVGTAENIPRMAGVNVDSVKIKVFVLAAVCYGIAGVLGGIRLGQGQIQIGQGMMFPAQAAVVIGGTSLSGGKGGVINTLVGVIIMTVLENGLLLMGISPYIKTGIQGAIIILAVALTVTRSNKEICK